MARTIRIASELVMWGVIVIGAAVGTRYLSLNFELVLAAAGIVGTSTFVAFRTGVHDSRESATTLDLRE